ncbi:hypothetical protein FIC87_11250 [Eggerthella lenta]|uniref:Lipoprotein n=1 Tax=Eggerthella lenta TaxID=84112 RepID=A0A5C5BSE8_EGGLN|nr:hypothetical protein [Eggerthella lenta]TNU89462.1 hypothetical protein FIC87_11250 [Eggerthella lenta]
MDHDKIGRARRPLKAVAGFAVCAVLALTLAGCGADTKGQTEETFGEAFYGSALVRNGTFQSDYVNESGYSVTDYRCSNIRGGENGTVNADIEASMENDSFQTNLKATGVYSEDGGYRFEVTESGTTPKKGIDFDREHGLENCESELSQGLNGYVCTAWENPPEGAWYLERAAQGEYAFTSGVGWACARFDGKPVFNKELEGAYARVPQADESGDYFITGYTISNFDPEALTFDMEYAITGNYLDKQVITGKATATLTSQTLYTGETIYSFEGDGTSDAGNGTAVVQGRLAATKDGSKTLTASVRASGNPPSKYASASQKANPNWPCVSNEETMEKQ